MIVSTFDNAPPLEGFKAPAGRHCGQICVDRSCPVCGEFVTLPSNVVLGTE